MEHSAAVALRGMGYAYIELGNLSDTQAVYMKSLELEPDNRRPMENDTKFLPF